MTASERVELMMQFEDGYIKNDDVDKLFQDLVDTGLVWQLQGFYGRYAEQLISEGRVKAKNESKN